MTTTPPPADNAPVADAPAVSAPVPVTAVSAPDSRWWWATVALLGGLAVAAMALAWRAEQRLASVEQELVRRQQDSAGQSTEARMLAKQGINPDGVSFAEGQQLISEIFRRWKGKLCSFKQAKVLRKYGYDTEVSFDEASATIDALARNGWRRVEAAPAKGDPAWN